MTAPEFCSGFGGSANAFLTALNRKQDRWGRQKEEVGPGGQSRKEAEPLVRGEGKESRDKAHAQTGPAAEGNGSWCIPLMNLSGLGSDTHRQAQPNG